MAELSANLLLPLLAKGDSAVLGYANWGAAARAAMEFLEDAVTESASIAVTGANVTLTDAEERALYITVTGTMSASLAVETSGRKGFWIVKNGTTGAFTLTFGPAAGTKVTIPQGQTVTIYCDGTNALAVGSGLGTDVTPADGVFLVGDGTKFVAESGATARASIGANDATNLTTGTLNKARLPSDLGDNREVGGGNFTLNAPAASNANFWLDRSDGTHAGLLYWSTTSNETILRAYDTAGTTATTALVLGGTTAGATLTGGAFNGSGAGLTALNASNLTTGTVADARLPSTMSAKTFTGSIDSSGFFGSTNAAGLVLRPNGVASAAGQVVLQPDGDLDTNGSIIAGGTVTAVGGFIDSIGVLTTSNADKLIRLRPNTDGTNQATVNSAGLLTATSFSGNGASLTSLNASNVASGTLDDGRLPGTMSSKRFSGPIYSDSNLHFERSTGGARLTSGGSGEFFIQQLSGVGTFEENWLAMARNGQVEVYHNGSKKLETASHGATVTGELRATEEIGSNLGVFANILGGEIRLRPNGLETTTSQVTISTGGLLTAPSFSGSGASLTALNASNVSSGTLNADRLPSTLGSAKTVTGNFYVTAETSNANMWLRDTASRGRGLFYFDDASGTVNLRCYDTAGAVISQLQLASDGASVVSTGDFKADQHFTTVNAVAILSSGSATGELRLRPAGRLDATGQVAVTTSLFTCSSIYNATTATAANVNVDASGNLRRSTSSIRYKTAIEDMTANERDGLLGLRPVTYQSLAENDDQDARFYGFIAEEVAEIDPRLVHWDMTDPANPVAEGVQYDRLVTHLTAMVQDMKKTIDGLTTRVAALEA